MTVSLANGSGFGGDAQDDELISIENLVGSAFDDNLIGNNLLNTLNGGAGDDTIEGGAGADTLIGGIGSDTASYATSAAGYAAGLVLSSLFDLPSGAVIVWSMAVIALAVYAVRQQSAPAESLAT